MVRCKEVFVDRKLLRSESDIKKVGFGTAAKYTAVQVLAIRDDFSIFLFLPR